MTERLTERLTDEVDEVVFGLQGSEMIFWEVEGRLGKLLLFLVLETSFVTN